MVKRVGDNTDMQSRAIPAGSAPPVPQVSVVVPLHNESGNIAPLMADLRQAMADGPQYEVVLVDDGSTDDTRRICLDLAADDPRLRVVAHDHAGGQSAAVHSGVLAARAPLIATMDGDGQNPPLNIPRLLEPLLAAPPGSRLALVAGQRVGRRDTLGKRLASRFANALRSRMLRDGTRDTGCGLKAFRRDAYLGLPFFNHQHRYLPALFARDGWDVAHRDVTHAARLSGSSNYTNIGRALVGITDLLGVAWLIRRRKRASPSEITAATAVPVTPITETP